jgi:hypothetical protein
MLDIGQGRPESLKFAVEALSHVVPPERIEEVIRQVSGGRTFRVRQVPLFATVWLVACIGLFGDLNISSIWRQVCGTLGVLLEALSGKKPVTGSALSQARQRLGARVLRQLFKGTGKPVAVLNEPGAVPEPPSGDRDLGGAFYNGLRLMAIDGQKMRMPDTPENSKAFGRHTTKRDGQTESGAYPQLTLMELIETGTHVCLEMFIRPACCDERPAAAALLKRVPPDSLLTWDKGFYSYKLLEEVNKYPIHLLGRVPSTPVFEVLERLLDGSHLVYVYPNSWARRRGDTSKAIKARLIRYTVDDPKRPGHGIVHRLITTLLDAKKYPAEELVVVYHQRWEIEIDNDEIKTHQIDRQVTLRSKTPAGVVQEAYGLALAHNAIRLTMNAAAVPRGLDPRRLSFLNSLRIIRETIPHMRAATPAELPKLYQGMLALIAQQVLPLRDNRINPRVIKIKMSKWPKKRACHRQPTQPAKPFKRSVVILI